jgi:hypothetical protein
MARVERDIGSLLEFLSKYKTPSHLQPGAANLPSYSSDYRQLQ